MAAKFTSRFAPHAKLQDEINNSDACVASFRSPGDRESACRFSEQIKKLSSEIKCRADRRSGLISRRIYVNKREPLIGWGKLGFEVAAALSTAPLFGRSIFSAKRLMRLVA